MYEGMRCVLKQKTKLEHEVTRLCKDQSGVTLIELMFAVGVLAVALSLLFGSLMSISLAGKVTQARGVAAVQLASVMEELQGLSYESLLEYVPPTLEGAGTTETVEINCFDASGAELALPVSSETLEGLSEPLPNPLRVESTVTWYDERGHEYSFSVSQ